MQVSLYEWTYLVGNIFGTFTVYKFLNVFFQKPIFNKCIIILFYISYFFVNNFSYLLIQKPIISLCINIIYIFVLTHLYNSTWKHKVLASLLIYVILMLVECLVVIFINFFWSNVYDQETLLVMSIIMTKIVSYIVVLFFYNMKNLKNGYSVTNMQWFAILAIPIGTLIIFHVFLYEVKKINSGLFLCLIILFAFNLLIFHIYDALEKEYNNKVEYQMAKQEIEYYKKQFKIISETQDTIKMMHHDMKNHVIVLKALANKTNSQEVNLYLSEYLDLLDIDNSIAKSGNINVDSILNYKLIEAEKKEITVQLVYKIPEKLNVLEFDLEVVIGNLFDNAIEAVEKMSINNKWIKIEIEYDRGIIFIVFSNPYIYVNENLESTKMDSRMHGIGLKSVARIVNKYNGEIEINKEENVFQINILMYEKG